MESLNPVFTLYGSKYVCARTDTAFFAISQVCTRGLTLVQIDLAFFLMLLIFPSLLLLCFFLVFFTMALSMVVSKLFMGGEG